MADGGRDTVERSSVSWKLPAAFAAIYLLWGGTFLAIRVAVLQVPPFLVAGLRFAIAGTVLYGFARVRGAPAPEPRQWRNLFVLSLCMFVATYGPLFWAAQFVTSSITSVIEATLPLTTIALEVFVFRTLDFQRRLFFGVALGFAGVVVLFVHNTGQQLAIGPCLVILAAGVSWSLGAVLNRRLQVPDSRTMTAGAQMMLGGFVLLALSALRGEFQPWPRFTASAFVALLYLITCGSIVAYTAYVWLLGRMPATRVASHAYVNPLVAVALGYFVAGDLITPRTVVAAAVILSGVVLILTRNAEC